MGRDMNHPTTGSLACGGMLMPAKPMNPPLARRDGLGRRRAGFRPPPRLVHKGMVPSMSGKADCWDNAVAESLFATLEKELLATEPLKTRAETRTEIAEYIESYYNTRRRHSYLDYVSPLEFELTAA